MSSNLSTIIFPTFDNFPNCLTIGTVSSVDNKDKNKKTLVIMDISGSMGENINNNHIEGTKYTVAKNILVKLSDKIVNKNIDIIPFNNKPLDICNLNDLTKPGGSTCFTTLIPVITNIFNKPHDYGSVIFMSDGLPSENKNDAHNAIKNIGVIVREGGCNPVSVAIGDDADGYACALFSGKRGYECFIKNKSQFDVVVDDIFNGIYCNYITTENNDYVPIEKDGKYYYVDKKESSIVTNDISFEMVMKYLNLIILSELSKNETDYNKLKKFVEFISETIKDKTMKMMLVNHFNNIIGNVITQSQEQLYKASAISSKKQAYRNFSQQI